MTEVHDDLSLVAQRDEFKRRSLNARRALEDIRTAYEEGDFTTMEYQINLHTAITHDPIKRPATIPAKGKPADWTMKGNSSNSSDEYLRIVSKVRELIRHSALTDGDTDSTARLIVSQLAHEHGMSPKVDGR